MRPKQICKHCGRYKSDHEKFNLTHEETEKILKGFSISLSECLISGGFEAKEPTPT